MGEFCPLRIPLDKLRAAASPTDNLRKDSTLPPVTTKKSIVFYKMPKTCPVESPKEGFPTSREIPQGKSDF